MIAFFDNSHKQQPLLALVRRVAAMLDTMGKQMLLLVVLAMAGLSMHGSLSLAATLDTYRAMPPFLASDVKPNVLFMYDNSGSMKSFMYQLTDKNNNPMPFDSSKSYYGLFDAAKKYKYDPTVPVDFAAFDGNGKPYDIGDSDGDGQLDIVDQKGAFVEDSSCTLAIGSNCWSGNFLNWFVTRRADAARMVLVGGKVEDRDGYDYFGDGSLQWKVVGNNEPNDEINVSKRRIVDNPNDANTTPQNIFNPFPGVVGNVTSRFRLQCPVDRGKKRAEYPPYAIFYPVTPSLIIDEYDNIIGESGTVSLPGEESQVPEWTTVPLQHSYVDPVVVAAPLSNNERSPAVVWIKDVSSDSFTIRTKEWDYLSDQYHKAETVMYFVIEKGDHILAGGEHIVAGVAPNVSEHFTSINFGLPSPFPSTPVVLASVIHDDTSTPPAWNPTTTVRLKGVSETGFEVKVQAQRIVTATLNEQVDYIAFEQGEYGSGNHTFIVGTVAEVTSRWKTINFPFGAEPNFVASIQSFKDTDTAAMRYRGLSTNSVDIFIEEEKSDPGGSTWHRKETVGYVLHRPQYFNIALVTREKPKGLLHDVKDKVRLGISFYKYAHDNSMYLGEVLNGGTLQLAIPKNPFVRDAVNTGFRTLSTYITSDIENIVDAIEHYPLVWGTTPLAENYFEAIRYFQQVSPYYNDSNGGGPGESYKIADYATNTDLEWDPYYFQDPNGDGDTSDAGKIGCAKSFVLLFTDGGSYRDGTVPDTLPGYEDIIRFDYDGNKRDCYTRNSKSTDCDNNLDDVAKWAFCDTGGSTAVCTGNLRDLRTDLDDRQNLTTYTVAFGSETAPGILRDAAKYGGGEAYGAKDGRELKEQLTSIFSAIAGRASGTALSVVSRSSSGEGAVYQSVFFPEKEDSGTTSKSVNWAGQVHALFVDAYGFLYEDTDGNNQLNPLVDRMVTIKKDGTADVFVDANGNHVLDQGESNATIFLEALAYLWNSSDWLNSTKLVPELQRSEYISKQFKRYIFTGVDANHDGFVGPTETKDFVEPTSSALLFDTTELYPYLSLYPTLGDRPQVINPLLGTPDFDAFLMEQTKREVNWIRGKDFVDSQGQPETLTINGVDLPGLEMRSRQIDYDNDGTDNTWRLGDIVYSSPTVVGRPMENFHFLYNDASYSRFADKYLERRQVIYTGANDGMIHAFNGGFYNARAKAYCREVNPDYDPLDVTTEPACLEDKTSVDQPELGAELWGYIPFNLLPHLYWLTEVGYSKGQHVYFVDQKPRIFDAKIFQEESECGSSSGYHDSACIHPDGWGTVMVIGMRLGGGTIATDVNRDDKPDYAFEAYKDSNLNGQWDHGEPVTVDCNNNGKYDPGPVIESMNTDCNNNGVRDNILPLKSSYMVFDITDPERKPSLLGELTPPELGFTTVYPSVIAMRDGDHDNNFGDYDSNRPELGENRWFLAFGSGPADTLGYPGAIDKDGNYDSTILDQAVSRQQGGMYLLDLHKLATNHQVWTLNDRGVLERGFKRYVTVAESDSFIGTPITVDFDLDYNADVLYYGTVSGSAGTWGGKLHRIVLDDKYDNDDDMDPVNWAADTILFDTADASTRPSGWTGQAITAAPTVGKDDDNRYWVFFGTGRFLVSTDKGISLNEQNSFYGIKEPVVSIHDPAYPSDPTKTIDVLDLSSSISMPTITANVALSSLMDVTEYDVYAGGDDGYFDDGFGLSASNTWDALLSDQESSYSGWRIDFEPADPVNQISAEKNISQAALFGGLLTFTTFTPTGDVCDSGGTSSLWAVYYKTGTAYKENVFGLGNSTMITKSDGSTENVTEVLRKQEVGDGMLSSPSIHVGRESGSAVFVQSSKGEVIRINEENPLHTKSSKESWRQK